MTLFDDFGNGPALRVDVAGPHPHHTGFGLCGLEMSSVWGRDGTSPPAFFVGIGQPQWLNSPELRHPVMISRTRLHYGTRKKPWPRARVPWALDSGAFSAWKAGGWTITAAQWAEEIRHHAGEIGNLEFAAGMDWLVTSDAVGATGRSVDYHIAATVENYCEVAGILTEPGDPLVIPTVQGRDESDYEVSFFRYLDAGVDLCRHPLVGAGSLVGARRPWHELRGMVAVLGEFGVSRVHGFGVYGTEKLTMLAPRLVSVDSSTWSRVGRRYAPTAQCAHGGRQEQNCVRFAMEWADAQVAEMQRNATVLHTAMNWIIDHAGDEHWSDEDLVELDAQLAGVPPPEPMQPRARFTLYRGA
jgi:hypothetical protein